MREHLRVTHCELSNIYYIEQKMITTLISHYCVTNGRDCTVEILTNAYARRSVDRNVDQIIRKTFQEKTQTIPKTHPLIILQYPHSSHVNKHQNIANINIYTKLKEY